MVVPEEASNFLADISVVWSPQVFLFTSCAIVVTTGGYYGFLVKQLVAFCYKT